MTQRDLQSMAHTWRLQWNWHAVRTWLCSLLLLPSATTALASQSSPWTVSGVVLDTNGRPIDAACVLAAKRDAWLTHHVLAHPTARTMKDGTFLCPVKDGEDVVIAVPGKSALLVYIMGRGVPLELGPLVLSEGHTLKGRVVGPEGRPLAGVLVAVKDWIGPGYPATKTSRAQTDEKGEFAAPCLPARQLELVLEKEGYTTRRIGPVSVAESVQEQMIPGPPPPLPGRDAGSRREPPPVACELAGRVVDPAGVAIVGAKVWSSAHEIGDFHWWVPGDAVTTDAEGRFRFTTLPARKSCVYAWHSEHTLSPAVRIDLDVEPVPRAIEIRMSLGECIVGRFDGSIGPGWHVQTDDITEHGAADGRPNPPAFVPVKADGSFRIPRVTKGRFWVRVVIPSLDEVGDPHKHLGTFVNVPQQEGQLVIDADEHRPGFVEGAVRLSKPGAWRRLVVLAEEQLPPPRGIGGVSCWAPERRYGVLDEEGHFRLGLRPAYYEFSVADPLTGVRLHTWAGTVHVRADDSFEREVDLAVTQVPVVMTPPTDTHAWFRGFWTGTNWPAAEPEFWNDVPDRPRQVVALFGASGTFDLHGYWNDNTGAYDVSETVEFDANDPRPVRVQLKRTR